MENFSKMLVKKRHLIFGCMFIFAIISLFFTEKVNIITDMTTYLPNDSSMKQGIDIMKSEFPNAETEQTIRVMADNLNEIQKKDLLTELQSIKNVSSVNYDAESEDYNIDNHTLYILHTEYDYNSAQVENITNTITKMKDEWNLVYDTEETGVKSVPPSVMLIALAILLIILFFMCNSWGEPLLFLTTIGIAIVINKGTNAFLSGVSETTYSIAAILQLVLSMDYSIILMNRYRQELKVTEDKEQAMTAAIKNAFSSIASSSLTTIVGLLALVFMNFKIGADMGIVLAKGVLISLICIFTVLPALILFFDKLIQKTAKKVISLPMQKISHFSFHGKYVITGLFAVAFVVLFFMKGNTAITYSMTQQSAIDKVFPKTNTLVVLYENKDEKVMTELAKKLENNEYVKSVSAYATTLGKQYKAPELAQVLNDSGMADGMSLDTSMLQIIYYMHFKGEENPKLTLPQFVGFMQEFLTQNEEYSSQIDEQTMQQFSAFGELIHNQDFADKEFTASELYSLIGSQTTVLDEATIQLIYQMYFSQNAYDDTWTMSIEDLFAQIKQMSTDETYAFLIPSNLDETLKDAEDKLSAGKEQLVASQYSRIVLTTTLPEESEETNLFLSELSTDLKQNLSGSSYIIGNSAMEYEMSQTFDDEWNKISLITMGAIFIVVLFTFRSISVPIILLLVIQCSVYATMVAIGTFGGGIYYLALMIVQSILMGATIDYGILFSNYYRENRKNQIPSEALTAAYNDSIHTIMTSGLIMTLVTFIQGFAFPDPAAGQICHIISAGALIAIILILFVLPGILCSLDKITSGVKNDSISQSVLITENN